MIGINKIKRLPPTYINKVNKTVPKPMDLPDNPNDPEFYKAIPYYLLVSADDIRKLVNKIPAASKTLAVIKYGLIAICFSLEKLAKYYRVN